ncbi:MAG: LytTR family DNA-binding domain-containing protein [Litorimonas sp.]
MAILKQYSWQIALVILGFGFVFSVLGVYDTHALPFYMRFTFWTATMATGLIATILIMPILVTRVLKSYHPAVHVIMGSIIASIPVTLVITIFNPTFSFESSLKIWMLQFGYVLIISLVVAGVAYPFLKKIGAYGEIQTTDQSVVQTFLKRLPIKYHNAELLGFSAEDHYLRVYTNKGEDLILLRFADAMRELSNAEGLQVHRSWWVAKSGVSDVQTNSGKKVLVLASGIKVPVSRTFMKNAKQAFSF